MVQRLGNGKKKIGSVTVIGAGIAGIQAALDLAEGGFKVHLVESKESIGGVMTQLDKTFPTNDCAACMMGPKLVEVANHPNIEVLAYTDVIQLAGEAGNFNLTLKKKARAVDPETCIGCGICAQKCPVKISDPFNLNLNHRSAAYIPYPQAVPLIYTIDKQHCRYFLKGKCRICEKVCPKKAIVFDQKDAVVHIETGAIIVAGGIEPFDAGKKPEYGFGRWPNVVTSLQYERILSAAGPFKGHIQRVSDGKKPNRVAWIQCVGSRDVQMGAGYCSSVCCMYATKQAMITKEHDPDIETAIFYIDIRAHGEGFDRFYERSKSENNVRFIRSMVSRVVPNPGDDTLKIVYIKDQRIDEETFDMVVLSVGLRPNPEMGRLCETLGVRIESHGFCESDNLETVTTNRLGIYVCGAIQGPKGIPGSVQQGSGAAGKAMSLLASARGTRILEPNKPAEKDITGQEPRIGVFICHCGINIAGVVDVKAVAEFAKQLPNVTFATDTMFACSTDQQGQIQQEIKKHRLNRVVVASCTPRTHEPLFRDTLRQAGLNPYLFELANIREQDSWVHQSIPDVATEKAKDLVEMSISRARLLRPLYDVMFDVVQRALVIGGGLAGLTAAAAFAEKEIPVVLVEREAVLGGHATTLYETAEKARPSEYVKGLIRKIENHPLVQIRKKVEVEAISGVSGNFNIQVSAKGKIEEMSIGAIVVATGGDAYRPSEYQYGLDSRVVTQKEFESMLVETPETLGKLKRIVMIQCVGSREPEHMYCSRVCCTAAVKNSLKLKTIHPEAHISILFRDIRTFGFKEDLYLEARQKGVRFFRFERENKPQVDLKEDALTISSFDVNLQNPIQLKADLLVLSAAIRPHKGSKRIAEALRLPFDEDGFFMEAHLKLRPLDFPTAGIYLCGLAQGPKFADETIVQAQGAVARAMAVLSKQHIVADAMITHVDPMICRACGECEKACLFEAIKVIRTDDGRQMAQVTEGLCTGCGACNVACPTGAASLSHFEDDQINAMIKKSTN